MGVVAFYPVAGFLGTGREKFRQAVAPVLIKKIEQAPDSVSIENRIVQSKEPRSLLSRLIVREDEESFQRLSVLFRSVPQNVLERCLKFGTGYYLLSRETLSGLFHDLPSNNLAFPGGYSPQLKACLLQKEAMTQKFLPFILLAHALDHAIGKDRFASLQSPLVQSLYLTCKRKKRNHQFMSSYGESGPMEYFAESAAFYFYPDESIGEILKRYDRAMYDYLRMLLESLR